MRYLDVFSLTGSTSCMVRAGAVALTLYMLAKSLLTCLTKLYSAYGKYFN